jgi:hypothetical protein
MAFYVKCDGHGCTEVAVLAIKGQVFNPVNELPAGWRVVMWTAPAPEDDADEMSPQKVALAGLTQAIRGTNPVAGAGLAKFAQAIDIGQQLAAMKRMQVRRACVCPTCSGKLVLGTAEVVGEIHGESSFPGFVGGGIPGFIPGM